jgi:hypothetical protein
MIEAWAAWADEVGYAPLPDPYPLDGYSAVRYEQTRKRKSRRRLR